MTVLSVTVSFFFPSLKYIESAIQPYCDECGLAHRASVSTDPLKDN